MKNMKPIGLTALAALLLFSGSAATAGGQGVTKADPPVDVSPPVPYIRASKRQDLDDVFKRGIQTTCGTEDDERDVECTMSASRKGRVLASETETIKYPYNRFHFELELSSKDQRTIRKADPPIEIKLVLQVSDEAGNVGTAQKVIRLVKDL